MRTFALLLASLLASLLAPPAAAAVLTVGPAGQFQEIADAIAAAQPGDVILVAPGSYAAIEISKPLSVLGDGTGAVVVGTFGQRGVFVTGIAAGEEVVVSGLEVRTNPVLAPVVASVHVADCDGTVVLHDLVVEDLFNFTALQVERAARVLLLASRIPSGGPPVAVRVVDAELWIVDSLVRSRTPASGFAEPGYDAVRLTNGVLRAWRSTLSGGHAGTGKPLLGGGPPHGGDGVDATGSVVLLHGGTTGAVTGGDGEHAPLFGGPGDGGAGVRLAQGSSALVQAALPVAGGLDATDTVQAPPVVADAGSSAAADPVVHPVVVPAAPQVALGGALVVRLEGAPGAAAVLFVSSGTGPTLAFPGVQGVAILDLLDLHAAAATVLDPGGGAAIPLALPPAPALLGARAHFQAVTVAAPTIALSSPALVAVTP